MNKQRIKQLFLEVATKAKAAIDAGDIAKPAPGIVTTSLLVRSGLIFKADIADVFFKNVDEAAELAKADPAWSKSAVDQAFSEGLAAISDGASVSVAATEVEKKLDKKAERFTFRFAIYGLSEGFERFEFGEIKIGTAEITFPHAFGPFTEAGVPSKYVYAEAISEGVDSASAKLRAERIVDTHLSVLNIFCANDIPTTSFLSRRFSASHDYTVVQEKSGDDWLEGMSSVLLRRTIMPPELQQILSMRAVAVTSDVLKVANQYVDSIVASLQIAGDALRETSMQNAFLLLAVALESALLGKKNDTEVSHQFAVRAALLSKGTAEQRRILHTQIKRLYRLRSEIVHKGNKSISANDLREMQEVAVGCLVILCISEDFSSMTTVQELDNWFLERMLTGPDPSL